MTVEHTAGVEITPETAGPGFDDRPPGERYFRHPGDVLRLVLWASATVLLALFIAAAADTSDGVRTDFGAALRSVPFAVRQLFVVVVQAAAIVVPLAAIVALAVRRQWRRSGMVVLAAALGALMSTLLDLVLDEPARVVDADGSWLISDRFPPAAYLAAAFAVATIGKPWLSRGWRRTADLAIVAVAVAMGISGGTGVPELALALAAGGVAGAALLVAFGAPNRRPSAASIATALEGAGIDVRHLRVERAVGGRVQLYSAVTTDGDSFIKVYSQDSRDADLLFRSYRAIHLRDSGDRRLARTLAGDVEHEALLLLLAERGGVACPGVRAVVSLPDGSMALAMDDVDGRHLDELTPDELGSEVLGAVWRQVAALHRAGVAHGTLRAGNILVDTGGQPVIVDLGNASAAASERALAMDRAELLASLAVLIGPAAAVASAAHVVAIDDLAAAVPFLQPLALSMATRRAVSKSDLRELRTLVAETTGRALAPLERLIRVRARTVVLIAMLTGAFYVLLPQLANVDDSVEALRSANVVWLLGAVLMSVGTYVASAVGLIGGVRQRVPFVPTVQVSMASSFVNRVTPANVGGMALNVRYLQKSGVPPAEAVTSVGLNVVAGGIVHIALLVMFFAWAGQDGATAFAIPSSSKLLVVVAVVLALVGVVVATRWGRNIVRSRVVPSLRDAAVSIGSLARSPSRLLALFGGSAGVTVAYISALACAVAAFDGGVTFAQTGAVFLGASLIAAAAPTPGGLGAMEAALVAGFTGIAMDPAIAVAVVLSYRLVTYWLPILPGWLFFRYLERHNQI